MAVLYGTRLLRVATLDPDGGVPDAPSWVAIETPQQANVTPVVSQGQQQELRGGDRLLAVIQEDDEYIGMDIQFTDAELNGDAMAIISGGTFVGEEYTPPALGAVRPHFIAELYVALYAEGSQHQSDVEGWIQFTFPNVSGSLPTFNTQDRTFLVPQFTLRCRDNLTDSLRFFTWKKVAQLPDAGSGEGE